MTPAPINLPEKFALFDDYWNPRIIGEMNGQHIKIAKTNGEFVWHSHTDEDELFVVVRGRLFMDFRDRTVTVEPGELLLVPRGTEHRPHTEAETWIMMIEPTFTLNTGSAAESERTRRQLETL